MSITSPLKINIKRFKPRATAEMMEAVRNVVESGQLAGGDHIQEFEQKIANLANMSMASATSNGFSALHLVLESLGIKRKRIAIPVLSSCMAILNAVRASGNEAVLVDSEEESPNMSAQKLQSYTDIKAIVSANYFGRISDIATMLSMDLPVIEDCAQSAGTQFIQNYHSDSDFKIFSFYPTKIINAIDGGMVCSNKKEDDERVKQLRYYGGVRIDDGNSRFNYKMNNINAAFGLAQLKDLSNECNRRQSIALRYKEAVSSATVLTDCENEVAQKFILYFDSQDQRDHAMEQLIDAGIPSCTELNPMTADGSLNAFPNAMRWWKTHLSVPLYSDLSDEEVDYICLQLSLLK